MIVHRIKYYDDSTGEWVGIGTIATHFHFLEEEIGHEFPAPLDLEWNEGVVKFAFHQDFWEKNLAQIYSYMRNSKYDFIVEAWDVARTVYEDDWQVVFKPGWGWLVSEEDTDER